MANGCAIRYNLNMMIRVPWIVALLVLAGGCSDESTETGEAPLDVVVPLQRGADRLDQPAPQLFWPRHDVGGS
ncbi:MAG: hypothetical protein ACI9OJ_003022, partial [Myxococcota bacterium]